MKRFSVLSIVLFFTNSLFATFWLEETQIPMNANRVPGDAFSMFSLNLANSSNISSSPNASMSINFFASDSGGCLEVVRTQLSNIKDNSWAQRVLLNQPNASFFESNFSPLLQYRSGLLARSMNHEFVLFPTGTQVAFQCNGISDTPFGIGVSYDNTGANLTSNGPPSQSDPGLQVADAAQQQYMGSLAGDTNNAVVGFVGADNTAYIIRRINGTWDGSPTAISFDSGMVVAGTVRCVIDANNNVFVAYRLTNGTVTIARLFSNLNQQFLVRGNLVDQGPYLVGSSESGTIFTAWSSGGSISTFVIDSNGSGQLSTRLFNGTFPANSYEAEPIAINSSGQRIMVFLSAQGQLTSGFAEANFSSNFSFLPISPAGNRIASDSISLGMDDAGNAIVKYRDSTLSESVYSVYVRTISNQSSGAGQWLAPLTIPFSNANPTDLSRLRMNNNSDALIGNVFSLNSNFFAIVNKKLSSQVTVKNIVQYFARVSFTKSTVSNTTPQCTKDINLVSFNEESITNRFVLQADCYNQLTWDRVTGASGYRVFRNGMPIATLSARQRSYEDHNRSKALQDTYQVRFIDAQGSTACNVLTWEPIDNAIQYMVCRGGETIATIDDPSITTYRDCNITEDQDCDSFTYVVKTTLPPGTFFTLNWNPVNGAQFYRVYRTMKDNVTNPKASSGLVCCLLANNLQQTSYTDTSPDATCPGYTVVAVDQNGCEMKNVVNWCGSSDADVIGYNVYKDGVLYANIPQSSPNTSFTFEDPASPNTDQVYVIVPQCSAVNTVLNENVEAMPLQGGFQTPACSTDPFTSVSC